MKCIRIALVLALLAAVPAFAADRSFDLTGWAAWVDTNSNGTFNSSSPNQPFDVNFNGKLGYGVGANIFFGNNLSLSLDGVQVRPGTTIRSRAVGGGSFPASGIRMTPLSAVLQFHFAPRGVIDPYIGAGGAYVLFDNVNGFGNLNVNKINFKHDAGLALNGGIAFRITPNLALTADGKYVPLKSSATAVYTSSTTTTRVKINPVIFSGGLTLRF
ncbi:MAG TPA: OmpW family outer membrane protein [Thermoanaerobaculia bacterium]|nr:OmpW family outer membrane protein [Thermoanaerobaculia bacterium]